MRRLVFPLAVWFAYGCADPKPSSAPPASPVASREPNVLSDTERAEGFRLLFDGETTTGWKGYRQEGAPAGWTVEDGTLTRTGSGGDIVTEEEFGDFELRLEWKVAPGGNSGILFRVVETEPQTYHSGPEMQVLDDAAHPDGKSRLTSAGSNYGLHASPEGVVHPAGEWNQVRIVVNGAHIEHWLNGVQVVSYELWSPEWEELVRNSKFVQWPAYGRARRGRIALQDHGDLVSYRSIRIRELP